MTFPKFNFTIVFRALSISLLAIIFVGAGVFYFTKETRAVAGINRTINFQGKLVNNPLKTNVSNTSYTVVFTIYDRASGGTVLWQETQTVTTADGIFRVNLGSVTPFPANFNFNWDGLYLGMKVNSDSEMTPRIQLAAVPYAFNAEKVSGLTVQDTSGNASTSGTLQIPNAKTINLGTQNLTFTTSGDTTLTLPTTGTLATLAGNEQLTNKTIGSTGLVFSGAGTDIATGTNEDLTLTPNGFGNINLTGDFNSQVLIGGSGAGTEFPLLVRSGIGNNAALAIDNLNSGDLFTASSSGTPRFSITNVGGVKLGTDEGSGGDCLLSTGTGGAVTWGDCGGIAGADILLGEANLAPTTLANTSTYLDTVSVTPSNSTGDVLVNAYLYTNSLNNANQTITVEIRVASGTTCTGALLTSRTASLTSASASDGPAIFAAYLDANAGNSQQDYAICALSTTNNGASAGGLATAVVIDGGTAPGYASFWEMSSVNGTLTPLNNTLDILIGGISTASAKFGILNLAGGIPTASVSSGLNGSGIYLSSNGSIQTTTRQTLTLGGSSTGSIQFNPGGLVNPSLFLKSNGDIGIGTANANPLASLDVRVNTVNSGGTVAIASVSGATSFASLVVNNSGAGDLFTASKSGARKFVINNNGNIQFAGTTNFLSTIVSAATAVRSWTLPDADGTLCLQSSSSCGFGFGTNWWTTSSDGKAVTQINTTQDFLIGGTSTSSAKFKVTGVNNSLSGLSVAIGNISTPQGLLNIEGAYTGKALTVLNQLGDQDIFTASSSSTTRFNITNAGAMGITSGYGSLDECLKSGGGATSAVTWGSCGASGAAGTWVLNSSNGTHYAINTTVDTLFGGTSTSSAKLRLASSLTSGMSALIINQTENQDIFTASYSAVPRFALGQNGEIKVGSVGNLSSGISGQCLISAGSGGAVAWGGCASGPSGNWWTLQSAQGTVYPINSTLDLLIGGISTASAKFGLLNVAGGTPTASISANSGNNALFLTGSGIIGTTNRQTLTIGNSSANNTTGNILINPNGIGRIGIGTSNPLATFDLRASVSNGGGTTPVASISGATSFASLVVNNSGTGDIFTASRAGRTIFTVNQDSVKIGTGSAGAYNPVLFRLDNKVNNGDPNGGSNGSMYYNASMGKFRCYENGAWKDCTGSTAKLGETTLGGAAATLDVTLSPTAEYISCTIAGPAPSGTGIIHMRFNSDSGAASYGWTQGGQLAGANLADTQDSSDDTIQLTGTNTPSTDFIFKIYFDNVSGNVKTVQWDGTIGKAAGVTPDWYQGAGNFYTTAGQITSVNFSRSANNFAAGTYAFCEGKDVADYAENYYTKDKTIQAADVVTGDPTLPAGVQKATKPYDQKLIGVISTKPAITLDEGIGFAHGRPVPVALAGRIPVKVSGVNGPIKAGDLLTSSSIPGVAMKATKAGAVLGQALESFSGEGTGKIMVFVKSGNFAGESITDAVVDQIPGIKKDEVGFEILDYILKNPSSTDEEVININEIITDRVVAGLEFVAPRIIAKEASIESILGKNASLSGTLTVDTIKANKIEGLEVIVGKLDFLDSKIASVSSSLEEQAKKLTQQLIDSKLLMEASGSATESQDNVVAAGLEAVDGITVLPGDLRVKGNGLIEGILSVIDTIIANNLVANGLSTFLGDVIFKENVAFNNNYGGYAVIEKDNDMVEVTFEKPFETTPIVNVNLYLDSLDRKEEEEITSRSYKYFVKNPTKKGFTIVLTTIASQDLKFSWSAVSVIDPKTIEDSKDSREMLSLHNNSE